MMFVLTNLFAMLVGFCLGVVLFVVVINDDSNF